MSEPSPHFSVALVAAAGKSERMRKSGINLPKALVPHPLGGTLASQLIDVFIERVDAVLVTLPEGTEGERVGAFLNERYQNRVRALRNAYPTRGLLGSLITAQRAFPTLTRLIFTPTDLSLVSASDVKALLAALAFHDAVVLEKGGKRGHPAGISRHLLSRCEELQTPKALFENAHVLQSQNPFIGDNLNTREDIERFATELAIAQSRLQGGFPQPG